MAVRKRLAAIALAAVTLGAAIGSPASARPQVECEAGGGYWDCWLVYSYHSGERWYLDGVHLANFNEAASAFGSCSTGGHIIRVTWDGGGRTSTDFSC